MGRGRSRSKARRRDHSRSRSTSTSSSSSSEDSAERKSRLEEEEEQRKVRQQEREERAQAKAQARIAAAAQAKAKRLAWRISVPPAAGEQQDEDAFVVEVLAGKPASAPLTVASAQLWDSSEAGELGLEPYLRAAFAVPASVKKIALKGQVCASPSTHQRLKPTADTAARARHRSCSMASLRCFSMCAILPRSGVRTT